MFCINVLLFLRFIFASCLAHHLCGCFMTPDFVGLASDAFLNFGLVFRISVCGAPPGRASLAMGEGGGRERERDGRYRLSTDRIYGFDLDDCMALHGVWVSFIFYFIFLILFSLFSFVLCIYLCICLPACSPLLPM